MNAGDYLILILIAAILCFAMIRGRKRRRNGCSGCCDACGLQCGFQRREK